MTLERDRELEIGLAKLHSVIERNDALVVAFSGGADSALLSYVATEVLGTARVLSATAVSASLASDELEDVNSLVREWGLRHVNVETHEFDNAAYLENNLSRCYFCKQELMDVLGPLAVKERAQVALGVNLDDLGEHRPGQQAAREAGAIFPLVEAGLTKAAVRGISRQLGLRTWDKPAAACLSSRIPHGTPVSITALSRIDRAESALRRLGFLQLRVRDYSDSARIEVELDALSNVLEARESIVEALHRAGYAYVTLDLEGFRSGNLARAALSAALGEKDNR